MPFPFLAFTGYRTRFSRLKDIVWTIRGFILGVYENGGHCIPFSFDLSSLVSFPLLGSGSWSCGMSFFPWRLLEILRLLHHGKCWSWSYLNWMFFLSFFFLLRLSGFHFWASGFLMALCGDEETWNALMECVLHFLMFFGIVFLPFSFDFWSLVFRIVCSSMIIWQI